MGICHATDPLFSPHHLRTSLALFRCAFHYTTNDAVNSTHATMPRDEQRASSARSINISVAVWVAWLLVFARLENNRGTGGEEKFEWNNGKNRDKSRT